MCVCVYVCVCKLRWVRMTKLNFAFNLYLEILHSLIIQQLSGKGAGGGGDILIKDYKRLIYFFQLQLAFNVMLALVCSMVVRHLYNFYIYPPDKSSTTWNHTELLQCY